MALGFYFNGTRCIGCKACAIACKDVKELSLGVGFRRVFSFESGVFPSARSYHYPAACNHCESPACAANCPTGAMFKAEDGTVQHDDEVCIGCKTCVNSCPYEVPQYIDELEIVQKCDACAERRAAGKNPSCVDACPMRALDFGDLAELEGKYGASLVAELPFLPAASETSPSTRINPKPASLAEDYRAIVL